MSTMTEGRRRRRRGSSLSSRDRTTVVLMMLVPTLFAAALVWLPAIASVVLSFFNWAGFSPLSEAAPVGGRWYKEAVTIYPAFWPAIRRGAGPISFAGEHTETLAGYMESAVRSGHRVARSIGAAPR